MATIATIHRGPRRRPRWRRKLTAGRALTYLLLTFFALFMIVPYLWMLSASLKPNAEIFTSTIEWLPHRLYVQNYGDAFGMAHMGTLFLNTAVVSVASVLLNLLFCSMCGFVFARLNFAGKSALFWLLMATMMVPFEVQMIPIFLIARGFPLMGGNNILGQGGTGLMNSYAGLVFPNCVTVAGIFMFRQFFLRFPHELEDASRIDGASYAGFYWRILMPNCRPVIATLALSVFLWSWNDFLWPLVIIRDMNMKTLQLGLAAFQQENSTNWGPMMAACVMITVPVIALFLSLQRYFVQNVTSSGLKG